MIPSFKGQSLQNSLQRVLLISVGSALLMAILGLAYNDWSSSKQRLVSSLDTQAQLMGGNNVSALIFDDRASAVQSLQILDRHEDIMGAVLYAKNNEPFAAYERHSGVLPEQKLPESRGEYEEFIYAQLPIDFEGERVGSILILSDSQSWLKRLYNRLLIVVGLFLMTLLIAVLISRRLHKVVPVLQLADTAQKVTNSQNYALRAEKLSSDEVGELTDYFNEMLNQIEKRDVKLQQIQGQLEQKVKQRTQTLEVLTDELKYQAFHDTLTGLANRSSFDKHLTAVLSHVKQYSGELSVLFFDLDRFKVINDTLGHGTGDDLLVVIAQRLEKCLRTSDFIARLGGDEFALLLTDLPSKKVSDIATKLINVICAPVEINGHQLIVTTSIGVSVYPNDGVTDTAMYRSKESGRNRVTFFSSEMNERLERRRILEGRLRAAIEQNDFKQYFQPKRDARTLKLVGVEALLRWTDEDGVVSPDEFIPLAEECGLITVIDRWVLKQACEKILQFYGCHEVEIQLSVNLSPILFSHINVSDMVKEVLADTQFPAHKLELEITESLLGSEAENVCEQLQEIRKLGVEISIDDFGVAYSSLSRLKQMPVTCLKIDRSFISGLDSLEDDGTMVRTIIAMAHNFNLSVVAEGVETEEQYQIVRDLGCDTVQGFLFGRPVTLLELEPELEGRKERFFELSG